MHVYFLCSMKVLLVEKLQASLCQYWVVQSQRMNAHVKRDYHLTAMIQKKEFLTRYKNPTKSIDVSFEREMQQRIKHNQKV